MNDEILDISAKPFLDHLEDLRHTIIKCVLALLVGFAIALPLAPKILSLLKHPLTAAGKDPDQYLIILEMAGGLTVAIQVTFWSGLLLALPFMVYFIGVFVFPGLHAVEKRAVLYGSMAAGVLFAGGVALGYFICLKYALRFMIWMSVWMGQAQEKVLLSSYVGITLKLLIAFGLVFELPLILYILGYLGIVNSEQLREKRRHSFVGILFIAMMLTPQDPFTMMIMALPLYALYEVCIWLIRIKEKKDAAAEAY